MELQREDGAGGAAGANSSAEARGPGEAEASISKGPGELGDTEGEGGEEGREEKESNQLSDEDFNVEVEAATTATAVVCAAVGPSCPPRPVSSL